MYNNDYMYAIERSDEYLAHYGVRGMRWGVRKAREMGGARGAARLSKQYAKAQKKLAKLENEHIAALTGEGFPWNLPLPYSTGLSGSDESSALDIYPVMSFIVPVGEELSKTQKPTSEVVDS